MIGGTGYLGYFAVREMVRRNHDVTAVGRPPGPPSGFLPSHRCQLVLEDFNLISDERVLEHFLGCDAVVFGGGADGRSSFVFPAIEGFRSANAEPTRRLVRLAKKAGVRRFIILGSYYTAIARTFPDLGILDPNPYILSRKEEADEAIATALRQREAMQKSGMEGAYDPVSMVRMQQHFLHLDPLPAMEAIGFGPDDLQRAIKDTVTATRLYSKK